MVRPLVAELRRRYPGVAVAETGHLDLHRRAEIGVAVVSADGRALRRACSTRASAWWPGAPRSSCCRPGSGCSTTRRSEDEDDACDTARARKLADRIRPDRRGDAGAADQGPPARLRHVTEARLTNDLREATVFYTVYGDDEERADTAAALDSANGVIRSEVGRQTGLRHTPSLEFVADALPENASAHRGTGRAGRGTPTPSVAPRPRGRRRTPATRPLPATRDERRRAATRTTSDAAGVRAAERRGLVIVDKPGRLTSHDVVARIRAAGRHPAGRPRRHARPDGHRRAGARRRAGDPAARPTWR